MNIAAEMGSEAEIPAERGNIAEGIVPHVAAPAAARATKHF
jgi:hypothetical protein